MKMTNQGEERAIEINRFEYAENLASSIIAESIRDAQVTSIPQDPIEVPRGGENKREKDLQNE